MANVGPFEIFVVLVIALVVFGPRRIPELGRSLGEGLKGFKESLEGKEDAQVRDEEAPPSQSESAASDN